MIDFSTCYGLAGAAIADTGYDPRVLEAGGPQNTADSLQAFAEAAVVHIGKQNGELPVAAFAAHLRTAI